MKGKLEKWTNPIKPLFGKLINMNKIIIRILFLNDFDKKHLSYFYISFLGKSYYKENLKISLLWEIYILFLYRISRNKNIS